jgi:hypothetical protein
MRRAMIGVLVAATVGCHGSGPAARYVLREPDRGVVAVPDDTDAFPTYHRTQALRLAKEHVGPDFTVTREEEFDLGPVTTNEVSFNRRDAWNWWLPWRKAETATTTNTTSTRHATEYRISYQKAGAAPPPDLPHGN